MKIFPAKSQRLKEVLRFFFASLRLCVGKLLALTIALSFLSMLIPIASASRDKLNVMPCCAGKAGHCDSGIAPKRIVQRPSEPMCGMDNSEFENDGITIVAESPHQHATEPSPSDPAIKPVSVSQPCRMDCGACAVSSSRQQRRELGIVEPVSYHGPSLTTHSRFEHLPFSFSSTEDWEQTSPRGPPADLR